MKLVQFFYGRGDTQDGLDTLTETVNEWIETKQRQRDITAVHDITHRIAMYGSTAVQVVVAVTYESS